MVHMFENGMPMILGDQVSENIQSTINFSYENVFGLTDGFRKDHSDDRFLGLSLREEEYSWSSLDRGSIICFI